MVRANHLDVIKIVIFFGFFLRIDSRESPQFALRIATPSKIQSAFSKVYKQQ